MDNAWKQIQEGFQHYEAAPKSDAEQKAYKDFLNTSNVWKKAHEEFLRRNLQFERLGVFNLFENSGGNAGSAIAGYKELEKQVQVNRQPFTDASSKLLEVLKMNQDSTIEKFNNGKLFEYGTHTRRFGI